MNNFDDFEKEKHVVIKTSENTGWFEEAAAHVRRDNGSYLKEWTYFDLILKSVFPIS